MSDMRKYNGHWFDSQRPWEIKIIANRLPHQQRCLSVSRPGPTLHEEMVFFWFLGYSQTLLLFLHFFILFLHTFPVYNLWALWFAYGCPIGLKSYIDKGASSIPKNIRCICIASCVFDMLPHLTRQGEWTQGIEYTPIIYRFKFWRLRPLVIFSFLLRLLSPFNCAYGVWIRIIQFEISFHSLKGAGSSICGPLRCMMSIRSRL